MRASRTSIGRAHPHPPQSVTRKNNGKQNTSSAPGPLTAAVRSPPLPRRRGGDISRPPRQDDPLQLPSRHGRVSAPCHPRRPGHAAASAVDARPRRHRFSLELHAGRGPGAVPCLPAALLLQPLHAALRDVPLRRLHRQQQQLREPGRVQGQVLLGPRGAESVPHGDGGWRVPGSLAPILLQHDLGLLRGVRLRRLPRQPQQFPRRSLMQTSLRLSRSAAPDLPEEGRPGRVRRRHPALPLQPQDGRLPGVHVQRLRRQRQQLRQRAELRERLRTGCRRVVPECSATTESASPCPRGQEEARKDLQAQHYSHVNYSSNTPNTPNEAVGR